MCLYGKCSYICPWFLKYAYISQLINIQLSIVYFNAKIFDRLCVCLKFFVTL